MYPTKQELEAKWWHRLVKVFFIVTTVLLLIVTAYVFYLMEEQQATRYVVVKTFAQYLDENKNDEIITKFHGTLDATASFLQEKGLEGNLGCLDRGGGAPTYLSESNFEQNTACDQETGVRCTASAAVCDGELSKIVKYRIETRYTLTNYARIAGKTLAVLCVWWLVCYVLYFKAFLYVVFGAKEKAKPEA